MTEPAPTGAPGYATWTSAERESFFAAVARHRRAAWRVTLASAVADILFALVVAVLMSPFFYAVIALLFDVVNLVHPAPNIVKSIGQALDPVLNPGKHPVRTRDWIHLAWLAALPGLIWMGVVLAMLRRVLAISGTFRGEDLAAREPNVAVLAEQRFANVVEEMAVAAQLPVPRLRIVEDSGRNAVAFGIDPQQVTVLISTGVLQSLSREQLQGIAAHLIGSIANGDMRIGLRAATTLSLFAFMARFSGLLSDRGRLGMLLRMAAALLAPTPDRARGLARELADPMAEETRRGKEPSTRQEAKQNWRDWVWLPLTGPVVITGFLSGLVQMMLLAPLVALAWRQRKYMADATAVRLTRDPDSIAGALQALSATENAAGFAQWAEHLAFLSPGRAARGPLGRSVISLYPSVGRRLLALQRMGAHVSYRPRNLPLWVYLFGIPFGLLLGGMMSAAVVLLAYVSIPLSALFLGIPFGILHALLRWHSG